MGPPIDISWINRQANYEDMDITKYVGNTKYKEKNNASNLRVYFDPNKYPVEEDLNQSLKFLQRH